MSKPAAGGFDLSKLSTGTKVAAGGAILYLISMFLPWFSVDLGPIGSATASGWDVGGIATIAFILVLVAGIVLALEIFSPQTTLPVAPSLAVLGAGGLAVLLVLLKLLTGYHGAGRGWGLFVALIAVAAVTAGGYLKMQE